MKPWLKVLALVVAVPLLTIGGYVAYLAGTYIDKTTITGSAHAFRIGASKPEALEEISGLLQDHPRAAIYVSFGPRAGDNLTAPPSPESLNHLQSHDRWVVLLDGKDEFFNTITLTFRDGTLASISRHRQNFELP